MSDFFEGIVVTFLYENILMYQAPYSFTLQVDHKFNGLFEKTLILVDIRIYMGVNPKIMGKPPKS